MSNRDPQNNDNLEQQKQEQDRKTNPIQIITNQIIRSFIEALQKGEISLGNESFGEAFINFLRDRNYIIIDKLKEILGKQEIQWSDIKDLYLESGSTLETLLTKEVFKKLKLKDATRGVVNAFVNKLQTLHSDQQYQDKLNEIRNLITSTSLSTEQDVENFLNQVKQHFEELIRLLPTSKLKNKIRKLKVTNKEIIQSLLDLRIINQDEAFIISDGEIGASLKILNEITKKRAIEDLEANPTRKEQLEDLLQNLLIANTIDFIYNSKEKIDKAIVFLKEGLRVPSLAEVINFSNDDFINWVRNNPNFLNMLSQNESCNRFLSGNKEEYSECLNYVLRNLKQVLIEYIKNKDQRLGQIFEKVFNGQRLDQNDKIYLINVFYGPDFRRKLIDTITIAYGLDVNDRQILENIINQFFDLQTNNLQIPHFSGNTINLSLEKDIFFCKDGCQIDNITDFWDIFPVIRFKAEFTEDSLFFEIFKDDLLKVKDKIISPYQRVKLKLDNNEEIEGYINLFVDKDGKQFIEILSKPIYEINSSEDILKQVPLEKVVNVETIDPLNYQFSTIDDYYKKFLLFLPQLIDERVYEELKQEELRKKLNRIFERKVPKYEEVKKEEEKKEKLEKNIFSFIKKELKRIDGEDLDIKKLEDLKKITLISKTVHIGLKGYEDDFVQFVFEDVNDEEVTIKLIGGITPIPSEYQIKKVPFKELPEIIKRIRFISKTFKFKKIDNYSKFENYFNKEANLELDSKYKENWERRRGSTKIKDRKFFKTVDGKEKEVKYFVKEYSTLEKEGGEEKLQRKLTIFKVELKDRGYEVRVCENFNIKNKSCNKWKILHSNLSYNQFIVWIINETNFSPMTQEELDIKFAELYNKSDNVGNLGLNWFSISALFFTSKNIINAIKHHFEEDKEIKAALLYKKMVNKLPGWGGFGIFEIFEELKDEADAEFDSRIMGYINKFKNRLIRADEGKGGAHGSRAAEIIKREIFEKVKIGKDLDWKTRLKAAGYLLYAMEKGPGPYFRKLGVENNSGIWIKALLGHEAYKQWEVQVKDMLRQLKEDPNNTALKDEIVDSEMKFIYNHEKTGELFSKNFASTLDNLTYNLYADEKAEGVYNEMKKKGNFYDLEIAFSSYVNNIRIPHAVGTLKALAERVEDEDHYINFYKNLLWIGLSGFTLWEIKGEQRETFDKICRTYGYQVGTLFHNPENLKKLLKLMDLIIKEKDIKLKGYDTFTEYLFGQRGLKPEDIDYYKLKNVNKSNLDAMRKRLEELRSYAGKDIVSVFDFSDNLLLNILEKGDNIEEIETYLNAVNEKLDDDWVADIRNLFTTKDAPYWIDGVLNLNRKLFNDLVAQDEGEFKYGAKAEAVMEALMERLYKMEDLVDNFAVFRFLLQKFETWFGGKYSVKSSEAIKRAFIDEIDTISKDKFIDILREPIFNSYSYSGKVPEIFESAVKKFLEVLYKGAYKNYVYNKDRYYDTVNAVFSKQLEDIEKFSTHISEFEIDKSINQSNLQQAA